MLKQECATKLTKASQGKNYASLVKQLIIQGLIKIEEDTVEIQCRQEDASKVQQVVGPCFLSLPPASLPLTRPTLLCSAARGRRRVQAHYEGQWTS